MSKTMPISAPFKGQAAGLVSPRVGLRLLSALGLVALAGCAHVDRMSTASIRMEDYRNRHPILLTESRQKLDIFPAASIYGLDRRSYAQVAAFGRLYHDGGQGIVNVFVPTGGRAALPRHLIPALRRALARGGAFPRIRVTRYPVANPGLASPVRLTFIGLRARVADKCGQWPRDLASGSSPDFLENKPYWNFGCAYQSAFAAQVADPRDLATPRAEDPADTQMRARAIAELRAGKDPATSWKTKNSSISSIGGQ